MASFTRGVLRSRVSAVAAAQVARTAARLPRTGEWRPIPAAYRGFAHEKTEAGVRSYVEGLPKHLAVVTPVDVELVWLSGVLGNTKDAPDSFADATAGGQTKVLLENLKDSLQHAKSCLDDVVDVQVQITDWGDWPAVNAVYKSAFATNPPARDIIVVNGLPFGAKVQFKVVAATSPESVTPPSPDGNIELFQLWEKRHKRKYYGNFYEDAMPGSDF